MTCHGLCGMCDVCPQSGARADYDQTPGFLDELRAMVCTCPCQPSASAHLLCAGHSQANAAAPQPSSDGARARAQRPEPATPARAVQVRPPHVVLVHGEKTEMMRLKGALEKRAAELGCARALYTPAVMQTVKVGELLSCMVLPCSQKVLEVGGCAPHPPAVYHTCWNADANACACPCAPGMDPAKSYNLLLVAHTRTQIQHQPLRVVRMAGRLAEKAPQAGQPVRGVLVAGPAAGGAGQQLLLHPDDLPAYTKLHRGRVTQRQVGGGGHWGVRSGGVWGKAWCLHGDLHAHLGHLGQHRHRCRGRHAFTHFLHVRTCRLWPPPGHGRRCG